jgi:iron complex outermembrane receptor protein
MNNGLASLCFVFFAIFSQVLTAKENLIIEATEDDYIGDVPRVLTVSRLSQSLVDAPAAVTVIDRETIRASGIVDIPEIFRLVPGFYVGTNAGFVQNTNHVVSYHGMTTAYSGAMQVLINGRSVYSPLYGGVQWSELPLAIADIERIEITRGPNAASYGANSFFGVINIITQNPSDQYKCYLWQWSP